MKVSAAFCNVFSAIVIGYVDLTKTQWIDWWCPFRLTSPLKRRISRVGNEWAIMRVRVSNEAKGLTWWMGDIANDLASAVICMSSIIIKILKCVHVGHFPNHSAQLRGFPILIQIPFRFQFQKWLKLHKWFLIFLLGKILSFQWRVPSFTQTRWSYICWLQLHLIASWW